MVTEGLDAPARAGTWRTRAIGIPLYALAAGLVFGGLAAGIGSAVLQGLEVALIGMLAANAGGLRERTPLLRSERKRRAALGWLLVAGAGLALAVLIPVQ